MLSRELSSEKFSQICISFILSMLLFSFCIMFMTWLGHDLIVLDSDDMRYNMNVISYLYFVIVSVATIGYGDIAFSKSYFGLVTGVATAIFIFSIGSAILSYVGSHMLRFNERLLSGFVFRASNGRPPAWIWQSLTDI